ncbi:DUF6339 family protein [Streptomyces acidiscabies]|uniref:DUF6339 family protein n=1 Tax=Streptomyces acidiscabies TaxID=42234 RepID=A0AAP6B7M6_9ACTN|nr:DUF6339 family protein [Streptomyces acidiscabies]MBP5939390.1 hypothetical protein [Streptomyces sp. LBUM 1476]MBZ3910530.1 hypothetical protein [Streptomyces acidiscabies]MDX2959530.1 DUF6339 family protein [Streptomyces acidiscabies]MDX3019182.1 DUF6339 family protein [Streptomyces acidiscabies]MDX3790737.1 DUF6339 family protein [Streptomyces acidiscabies]
MTEKPDYLPGHMARLTDEEAVRFITEGLLSGKDNVPVIALNQAVEALPETPRRRLRALRDLIDDAMYAYRDGKPTQVDAWLAPRLHALLRLTRAEAADSALWNYLALGVAPDFVVWRHFNETRKKVNARYFKGPYHKQAFARLWWSAELFRDGDDYQPVVTACRNQDMLNTVLRLDVIDHRPTAQALVRLMGREVVRTGRDANALGKAVNAAAATVMYDVLAPDVGRDTGAVRRWVDEGDTTGSSVSRRSLPQGPAEERTPEGAVERLTELFAELFAETPVRGKEESEGRAEED